MVEENIERSFKERSAIGSQEVKAISAFEGLTREQLNDCAQIACRRRIVRNERIFDQGAEPVRFHALVSGWVRILQTGPDGELSVMRFVGPGEIFGLFALFTGRGYPADAHAVIDSVELSWSESQLHELIERHPAIALNLVRVAAARLSELQERFREVATQPAAQRIANSLLRMSKSERRVRDQGPIHIPFPLTRKDVAALSATTLYTASRVMSDFEKRGFLATSGRRLCITSTAQLARIGDGH